MLFILQKCSDVLLNIGRIYDSHILRRDATRLINDKTRWVCVDPVELFRSWITHENWIIHSVTCGEWPHPLPSFLGAFHSAIRHIHVHAYDGEVSIPQIPLYID